MVDSTIERELIERIQSGDYNACDECIELHRNGVYRLALRLMGDPLEAEEVMQETFLSAFRAIHGFDSRSTLKTWLYRITYNAAMMRLRKFQPVLLSMDEPIQVSNGDDVPRQFLDWCCLPEEELDSSEARAHLQQAIMQLPEKLRSVFILREIEGLSSAETAEILSISPEAVKTRLHRARKRLRTNLVEYFPEIAETGR